MTKKELEQWEWSFADNIIGKEVIRGIYHNDVYLSRLFDGYNGCLVYSYRGAMGMLHPNGCYVSNYKPGVRISPDYSQLAYYTRYTDDNLDSITEAIKSSWNDFKS